MPSASGTESNRRTIPIGLVLLVIGLVIIIAVFGVWVLSVSQAPTSLKQVQPILQPVQATSVLQTPVHASIVTPTPDNAIIIEGIPILLPESPINNGRLPSFASVDAAPTSYNKPVAAQPLRLVIPQLGLDAGVSRVPLVSNEIDGQRYYQWAVPNGYEVGWHETSAPLGQPGNTVLNGHNNIYGEVFRDLIDLELGQDILLYDSDRTYRYRVTQVEILTENGQPLSVRLANAHWIEPTVDERITLISCWPYATNTNRLVVIAQPVES
ncbi:MAG TPA: sortase [Patescibacteria group bacterium]|nr:sortase [Patescibacteria group bacterium]